MVMHSPEQVRLSVNFSTEQPVIVGFSGGPDSLCLLDLLVGQGVEAIAVHVNHQLRVEAGEDAQRAAALARQIGATFVLVEADVTSYASQERLSVEEAARNLRYRALFLEAQKVNAQAVAIGHTADDQVETVLMHLLRGAGLPGLKGMQTLWLPNAWSHAIPLARPLLGVWRPEVLDYCHARNLQPVYDRSNTDPAFYRNRIRNELLPVLETYNPRIKRLLHRTSGLLAEEDSLIELVTDTYQEPLVLEQHPGALALTRLDLLSAPVAIQRRIWRQAIQSLRSDLRDIDYLAIERCLAFSHDPPRSKQIDLAAGLILRLEGERLWLADGEARLPTSAWPQVPFADSLALPIPGRLALSAGWQVSAEWVADPLEELSSLRAHPDPFVAFVQLPAGVECLQVRTRRSGERLCPLGMGGSSMKLSDLMVNQKIPARARGSWPVICLDDQIVWVPGCCSDERVRVSDPPGRVARLWVSQAAA
jgi:tRNA(Ile)-lysidine synthase